MWKVLLVEDETFVRKALKQIIRWEDMGFQVAGEAEDGAEALEFIRNERPDLVISDIVMPVMDGVELLKQTRELGLDSRFVMLTCMNEFEYARQALEYGASGYVLKLSMDESALQNILSKVDKELADRVERKAQMEWRQYQRFYEWNWRNYVNPDTLPRRDEPFESLPASVRSCRLVLCCALHGAEPFSGRDVLESDLLERNPKAFVHEFRKNGHTTVFYWSPDEIRMKTNGDRPFPYAGVYSSPCTVEEVPAVWHQALRQLDERWYSGRTGLAPLNREGLGLSAYVPLPWHLERDIIQSFELMREQQADMLLNQVWRFMEEHRLPMHLVKETAERIDKICAKIAGLNADHADDLLESRSHGEQKLHIRKALERYMTHRIKQSRDLTDHKEINKIIDYIKRNYDQDVTLKAMAKYVAMDESYLSGLFKKKTGETLIQYLHRVRIEQAKFYLEQTDWPLHEIGERVGFANVNYFFKIFKRLTRLTPTDYRNSLKNRS
ncbi:response regulator [Paenibacillus cisolokensis]|uniref:response regulator n=1 Tax=Paenibacillus cisolokensis TaxID=1658519 RepID=UPI003D2A6A9E